MNDSAVLLLGEIKCWSLLQFKEFTLYLTEMIDMKLLLIIFLHNPANGWWEYSNLSGRSCHLDLTPNSYN